MVGSLTENEQSQEPVTLRDESQSSAEGLADDEGKPFIVREADWKHVHRQRACLLTDSVFCTVPGALDPTFEILGKEGGSSDEKKSKNRNDSAGQSILIE